MIKSLFIKNFALIKEEKINFEKGLNIITGETGSGKSLFLKSLIFLCGARFSRDFIRHGEERCVLEAELVKDDQNIIIRRVFDVRGRSRTFLNDEPIHVEKLREISNKYLEYHGQNENQKLFNQNEQLKILDRYAGNSAVVIQLNDLYQKILKLKEKNEKIKLTKQKILMEKEIIEFQLNEINKIDFKIEDDIIISKSLKKASNQFEIKEKLDTTSKSIKYEILEKINFIKRNIDYISKLDNDYSDIMNRIDSLSYELEDILYDLEKNSLIEIVSKSEIDQMNEKLSILETLKRKYGGSLESVIKYREEIMQKVNSELILDEEYKKNQINQQKFQEQYKILSKKLTNDRKRAVERIIPQVEMNLNKLGMGSTKFKIDLISQNKDGFYPYGYEKCLFKISSNKYESPKTIKTVASGGELSRIQLSLKMLYSDEKLDDTIIFDEIDTGISGKIAEMTGIEIGNISKKHQVICITHLPQIAGQSDAHFVPKKIFKNDQTFISINKLSEKEKVEEIASIIGGKIITKNSKQRAREILKVKTNG